MAFWAEEGLADTFLQHTGFFLSFPHKTSTSPSQSRIWQVRRTETSARAAPEGEGRAREERGSEGTREGRAREERGSEGTREGSAREARGSGGHARGVCEGSTRERGEGLTTLKSRNLNFFEVGVSEALFSSLLG